MGTALVLVVVAVVALPPLLAWWLFPAVAAPARPGELASPDREVGAWPAGAILTWVDAREAIDLTPQTIVRLEESPDSIDLPLLDGMKAGANLVNALGWGEAIAQLRLPGYVYLGGDDLRGPLGDDVSAVRAGSGSEFERICRGLAGHDMFRARVSEVAAALRGAALDPPGASVAEESAALLRALVSVVDRAEQRPGGVVLQLRRVPGIDPLEEGRDNVLDLVIGTLELPTPLEYPVAEMRPDLVDPDRAARRPLRHGSDPHGLLLAALHAMHGGRSTLPAQFLGHQWRFELWSADQLETQQRVFREALGPRRESGPGRARLRRQARSPDAGAGDG